MTETYAGIDNRNDVVIGYSTGDKETTLEKKKNSLYSWDFWEDIKDEDNLEIIANALFADKGSGYDEMWNNTSKQLFKDAVHYVATFDEPKVSDLYKLLAKDSIKDIHKKLVGTASASMLDPSNEKTAMSVRTNTIAFISWMENFKETENKVSISKWFTEKNLNQGNWLFFKSTPKQRVKLRAFYSMLLDLCMNQIMELGENTDRRIWMVIDELPALRKLPSLAPSLSEFRKYGGCIIASLQSPHQLFEIYGQHNSYAMLDQFNTKFVFRTDENNFASYLCKSFGEVEYKESQENFSYGSHEMRDGVSMQVIEKKKPLLSPSDLARLENLEAYVKIPEKEISVVKVKVSYE
jgi:type IV secretory pathway TraG/TraD family ATPase VirD4